MLAATMYAPMKMSAPWCIDKGSTEYRWVSASKPNLHLCSQASLPQGFALASLRRTPRIKAAIQPTARQPRPTPPTSFTHQMSKNTLGRTLIFNPVWQMFWRRVKLTGGRRGQIHPFDRCSPDGKPGCLGVWAHLGRGFTLPAFTS